MDFCSTWPTLKAFTRRWTACFPMPQGSRKWPPPAAPGSSRNSTPRSWLRAWPGCTSCSSKRNMHYVILRDDDTNALTPRACLERLYRPFLDRGLPVNLATIPDVRCDVRTPDQKLEGFIT